MPGISTAIAAFARGEGGKSIETAVATLDKSLKAGKPSLARDLFTSSVKLTPSAGTKAPAELTDASSLIVKKIDALQEQLCSKFGPIPEYGAGMRNPPPDVEAQMKQALKTGLYQQVFADDHLLQVSDDMVSFWANTISSMQGDLRSAWERVAQGLTPQNDTEHQVAAVFQSRKSRWMRLSQISGSGSSAPTTFRVYRGVSGDIFLQDVARAWSDDSTSTINVRAYSLSSWSLDNTIASAFAQQKPNSVVYEAQVPFEQTLLDKWADGGTFVTRYPGQQEVVVATPKDNGLTIPKDKVSVILNGTTYTYQQRAAFFDALKKNEVSNPPVAA